MINSSHCEAFYAEAESAPLACNLNWQKGLLRSARDDDAQYFVFSVDSSDIKVIIRAFELIVILIS
jgi:hypothetical protein